MNTHRMSAMVLLIVTTILATLAVAQQTVAPASNVPALPADIQRQVSVTCARPRW